MECLRHRVPIELNANDAAEDIGYGLAGERLPAVDHFIKNASEGPNLRSLISGQPPYLLRRHVCGCAEQRIGRGRRDALYRWRLRGDCIRVRSLRCFGKT